MPSLDRQSPLFLVGLNWLVLVSLLVGFGSEDRLGPEELSR